MVCQRCGSSVDGGDVLCRRCGTRVGPASGIGHDSSPDQATILSGSGMPAERTGIASAGLSQADDSATRLVDIDATVVGRSGTPPPPARDDGPLTVGEAFGPRYHIIRLLGLGGMGAVYQAWDAELGVAVAIKVIRPEVMADPTVAAEISRRFKRELLLARQVTHKNVVRIHDLGDIGNIKYITMPYVEGADLATVLKQQGRLSPARTLAIARRVVAGLVEAHKADVVHRDLKPANIMIDAEDQPLIMDFGIARSTGRPTGGPAPGTTTVINQLREALAGHGDATVLGSVVGTIEYMAPEQARAESVDQRADIYALGLIMYDMLVGGSRSERAGVAIAELQARMRQPPPPVSSVVSGIPEALDKLISRCLEPDPAKRYQTTHELADELARLDDAGVLIPVKRMVDMRVMAIVLTLGAVALVGTWWYSRPPATPVKHEAVSVLIADFQNRSNDPTFDGTLEPMVKVALEGAGFISAYDRAGIRRSLGVRPPQKLDEQAAHEIAVKQGVNVILSGSVDRQGTGYSVSMKAIQAVTGTVIASGTDRASDKDKVVGVATKLVETVREGLGDDTTDDAKRFATYTLSATSVEAVRDYAAGMVAISNSKFQDAHQHFAKAVERDPKFGMGWTALAMASFNLDKLQDTEKYVKEALRHLDTMTERERYRTRGLYYLATSDYVQCVKEYGELVEKYEVDASGRNNLALCSSRLRKNAEAVEQMLKVVKILPNRALYRENLALYADYSGAFETAEREARALKEPSVFGLLAVAFSQVAQGHLNEGAETYRQLGKIDEQGASYMAAGLGDIAIYQGRFSEAVRILEAAVATDLAAKEPDRAAAKLTSLAYVQLLRRQNGAAIAAAEKALANSTVPKIRFLAARTFVEAGQSAKAGPLAAGLGAELQPEPQAYAKMIEGMIAVQNKDARAAIKPLTEANTLLDTWIGRFELGRAYFAAGAFTQADSEFDRCLKRRGEALSLFLDEEPTYGYLPVVYYYQGRVRQELNTAGFAESYRAYLDIRGASPEDPLLPDVRRRAGR
jgi:tetratricopeptide (TPR) repeat protein/tRNA A-37 threonylcarbamoyl transferase component Bud32